MPTPTLEIYRTESGSLYEVEGRRIRRVGGDGTGPLDDWTPYVAVARLPAALFRPGSDGEILEVVLENGRRIYTSRLVPPFLG